MSGVIVEVSARKFNVPFACPCCGNEQPDTEYSASYTRTSGKRVIRETTRGLNFPYCTPCLVHVGRWRSAGDTTTVLFILGAIGGAMVWYYGSGIAGGALFVGLWVLGLVWSTKRRTKARLTCGPTCVTPDVAVHYLGWSGSVSSFSFVAPMYAARFGHQNARNLINVSPELRRILEQAIPPPPVPLVAAARVVPVLAPPQSAEDPVLGWIAKIEGFKGPVARRNALERALGELTDPRAQQQLVLAASKIEVAAVLDKVDGLASVAAKKRHLQKAIEDIRSDNIPDELQAAELRQLEERLRSIG